MTRGFILLTAMPPTKGHKALIDFGSLLVDRLNVIVCTQPGEPFVYERNYAVAKMVENVPRRNAQLHLIHKTLPQEPEGNEGFWDMWTEFLTMFGFAPGDMIIASETYGKTLAEHAGGEFMPFDIERQINPQKATTVRAGVLRHFDWIDESFQPELIRTVTVFGAESTGKTTLSNQLAKVLNGHWLPEYARPYLENTVNEITDHSMTAIWNGQRALQEYGMTLRNKPFVIQDTDLWSTVGYWEMAPWDMAGVDSVPPLLRAEAQIYMSDLYIVTKSNIPFEQDPLRYGGTEREISDDRWIRFCERNALPHIVLTASTLSHRILDASIAIQQLFNDNARQLTNYQRTGSEYSTHGA